MLSIRTVPIINNFKLNNLRSSELGRSAANNQDKKVLVTLNSNFR